MTKNYKYKMADPI